MAIEKMKLVVASTTPDQVMPLIESVMTCPNFHPELATTMIQEEDGGYVYPNDHVYDGYLSRCDRIAQDLNLDLSSNEKERFTFDEIEASISNAESWYKTLHSQESSLSSLTEDDKTAIKKLREYPLDSIEDSFIGMNFGRIPNGSLSKISDYNKERFVFTPLHKTKQYTWILYVCLEQDREMFQEMFETLYFEPIAIPTELSDISIDENDLKTFQNVYGYLRSQAKKEVFYKYIAVYENRVYLSGFVPEDKISKFESIFDDSVEVKEFEANAQTNVTPPTRLKNGWFSAPFESLVSMYGLPQYGAFDPTLFFSITYSLLFGIMFGDLGQGLVLVLLGLYFGNKKGMQLGKVAIRIGAFSMLFGTLYGSVFGNETLLEPLLEPFGLPIHVASPDFTTNLLLASVALGTILILSSILINIFVSLRRKQFDRALFSQNGLAGFVFYGFIMTYMALKFKSGIDIMNPITIVLCIVLPLGVILLKEPLTHLIQNMSMKPREGWGAYFSESIFELFEVALSFVTNTMSFLRVGGFVLSHAGMMSVVMTLKEMSGAGGLLVVIVGNIIVIGLEGLIVGIQTLRLEYYEMFSRYYDGGGKPFKTAI
ncbi:MAG: V-type ATPase 116kDa subunit family protein [Erysipelothrix sp.]